MTEKKTMDEILQKLVDDCTGGYCDDFHGDAVSVAKNKIKELVSEEEIREVIRKYFYEGMIEAKTQEDYEFIDDNAVDLAKSIKRYIDGL